MTYDRFQVWLPCRVATPTVRWVGLFAFLWHWVRKAAGIRADTWRWSGVETPSPPPGLLPKRRELSADLGDVVTLTGCCAWLQASRRQHKKARTLPASGPFRRCSVFLGNVQGSHYSFGRSSIFAFIKGARICSIVSIRSLRRSSLLLRPRFSWALACRLACSCSM